jgi:hypothetical protein
MKRVCFTSLVLLFLAIPSRSQTTPTFSSSASPYLPPPYAGRGTDVRLLFDSSIGSMAGLGFKLPFTMFGFTVEKPIGSRMEIQFYGDFSPTHKFLTNDGFSLIFGTQGIVWLDKKWGVVGGMRFSRLFTSQFNKSGNFPLLGIALRDTWMKELPGRLFLTYEFPTGCVWATASNPCDIQSNRLQGVNFNQEFQMSRHLRFGLLMGFYRFCDQSNQHEPTIPRTCHFTGTSSVMLRFEFPGNDGKAY